MQSKIKMQTIQYRESRIWEIKQDKNTKSLAKNQVCAIFCMQDIRKNVLFKFIKLLYIWRQHGHQKSIKHLFLSFPTYV